MDTLDDEVRLVRVLLDLAEDLARQAREHRAEYPGAYADGLDAAADIVRDKARELLAAPDRG